MPGRRNPVSMSGFVEKVGEAVHKMKRNAHDLAEVAKDRSEREEADVSYVDLTIHFIGASGIPKMDVVGAADPYYVAKIDDMISVVSTVQANTLKPVWNETWRVKNVPTTAKLAVEILDKDVGAPHDDYIGKFSTDISASAKELNIEGPLFRRDRGTFWLKIDSKPSPEDSNAYPYLFDGPVRYSRHFSPTVGRLTNLNDARLYSTWKMYLVGVPIYFKDVYQHWNRNYKAAQTIFQGPASIAVRSAIQAGHRMLYARSTTNGFGTINNTADVQELLHAGWPNMQASGEADVPSKKYSQRVKPAVYTYIISSEDDSFRFSETGAAFFVDFASKHALHANCCETVRYSGEFHPRPAGGWENFTDDKSDDEIEWEFVIDNNSGTYAPDKKMLPVLRGLMEHNFPGIKVFALDREDPELTASTKACRDYALKYRGITPNQLQPTSQEQEETLYHQAMNPKQDY